MISGRPDAVFPSDFTSRLDLIPLRIAVSDTPIWRANSRNDRGLEAT